MPIYFISITSCGQTTSFAATQNTSRSSVSVKDKSTRAPQSGSARKKKQNTRGNPPTAFNMMNYIAYVFGLFTRRPNTAYRKKKI